MDFENIENVFGTDIDNNNNDNKEKRKRKQKVIYTPSNKSARSKRGYNWKQTEINNVLALAKEGLKGTAIKTKL